MQGPMLMPVKAAAKRLGVSVEVMYELLRSGQIGYVQPGRRDKFVPEGELDAYIEKATINGGIK